MTRSSKTSSTASGHRSSASATAWWAASLSPPCGRWCRWSSSASSSRRCGSAHRRSRKPTAPPEPRHDHPGPGRRRAGRLLRRRLRPVPGDGDPPRPERRGDGGAVPPGLGAGRGTGRGPDPGRGGGRRAAGGGGRRPRPGPPGRGRDGTHARAGPDRGRGGGGVHRLPRLGGLRGRGGRRGGPAPPAGRGHGNRGGPGHRPRTPVAQGVPRLCPGYGLVLGDVRPVPARPVRGRRRGRPGQRRRVPHRRGPGGRRGRSVAARRRAAAVGRGRGRPAARNIRRGASMTYPRDLHGYGPNPPDPQWPGGARLAVQFVINYEEGGERSILHGDRTSESFLTEEPKPARPNIRDLAVESMFEYGSRAGFWRLYRLFTERNLPV